MANIRNYIKDNLLAPLKAYPTVIQDTMIEIITQRLEELYDYTVAFPEILSPNMNRMDILRVIAEQFTFHIREEADIQEQINILNNILYVYSKRGSVDTIENMWKYYGGDLPKDVQIIIPSYDLFRYSKSEFSGNHKFLNGGLSSITLDNPSPIFIRNGVLHDITSNVDKSVAAVTKDSNSVLLSDIHDLNIGDEVVINNLYTGKITEIYDNPIRYINRSGMYEIRLTNSTYPIPKLREFLLKELVAAGNYIYFDNAVAIDLLGSVGYKYEIDEDTLLDYLIPVYYTPKDSHIYMERDLYDKDGNHWRQLEHFMIGESNLGELLGYYEVEEGGA